MQHDNHLSVPPLWMLFLFISFPQLSETVYSPALPDIVTSLHTGNHLVQWTLSIYFFGFAAGVFAWGRISDHRGRRPTMLIGISIYIAASLLCLLAHNIIWLLTARLIQGFGASCGSVLTQTIARESLPDQKRHLFFSTAGFVLAFAIASGPFIGGYLTEWFSWHANFCFLFVLGSSTLTLAYLKLPETRPQQQKPKSSISSVLAMLLTDKYVLGSIWLVAVVNGMLFSYYAEGPFIFIRLVHLSSSQYGWLGSLIALAALMGSLASKHFIKQASITKLIAIGCLIMLLSSAMLVLTCTINRIDAQHKLLAVILIMLPMMGIIFGSFGFIIPMTLSTALQKYQSVLGTAGALFGLSYYIIIAILTWIMGFIHNSTIYPMPIYFLILSIISCFIYYSLMRRRHD